MSEPCLYLASSSPRRREILDSLGLSYLHGGVDLDESARPGEAVEDTALRLATEKAAAVDPAASGALPILAADTLVVREDRNFGKPATRAEGLEMLAVLSGQSHRVLTAVALRTGECVETALSETEVRFRDVSQDEARRYWQSGEPRDKAGGYAIQGLGGAFVESIAGSYSGVVGLPVFETVRLLESAGIQVLAGRD